VENRKMENRRMAVKISFVLYVSSFMFYVV